MLQSLTVRNLALVREACVEFEQGLNVITGETGAGKSILMGALGLVLGGRADRTVIRSGAEKCDVDAVFYLKDDSAINELLDGLGLAPCEDGLLYVRRRIQAKGGGRNFLNDQATTVETLRRVGDLLVDMHGPHDHQSLLDRGEQLAILDAFGEHNKAVTAYREVYQKLLDLTREREGLEVDDSTVEQELDFLRHQVAEIEDADLSEGEEEDLKQEHATVANAKRILELTQGVVSGLEESDFSVFDSLAGIQRSLSELAEIDPKAESWHAEGRSIAIQIQELASEIRSYSQHVEGDPERLQWLEDRLSLVQKLKRKYGRSLPDILAFRDTAQSRLTDLEGRRERIDRIEARMEETKSRLMSLGKELSELRLAAAERLADAVTKEIQDLGFEHGEFHVDLERAEPGPSGVDRAEYGFMPNAGEQARPLRAIASSGEISRVMLAIKTVLADHDRIPVLVFDEIDANVGGETANAVGARLGTVAGSHQVICITHLPQVAVHGGTHFVVAKGVEEGRTLTAIHRLSDEDRPGEVARMLGGKDLTSVTLKHAREMLAAPKS